VHGLHCHGFSPLPLLLLLLLLLLLPLLLPLLPLLTSMSAANAFLGVCVGRPCEGGRVVAEKTEACAREPPMDLRAFSGMLAMSSSMAGAPGGVGMRESNSTGHAKP
jgi:hypothetical protein